MFKDNKVVNYRFIPCLENSLHVFFKGFCLADRQRIAHALFNLRYAQFKTSCDKTLKSQILIGST